MEASFIYRRLDSTAFLEKVSTAQMIGVIARERFYTFFGLSDRRCDRSDPLAGEKRS
jgi:hypothetical protein